MTGVTFNSEARGCNWINFYGANYSNQGEFRINQEFRIDQGEFRIDQEFRID